MTAFFIQLIVCLSVFALTTHATDYCKWDTFTTDCAGSDEVVMMTSAHYGRMGRSHCIERDYGYVGCTGDVLTLADLRCSGRRNCAIEIPDKAFDKSSICPKDLTNYFSATYTCLKVFYPYRPFDCSAGGAVKVDTMTSPGGGRVGYLASVVSEETGCGVASSPWEVVARPGQRLTFTLYDFSRPSSSDTPLTSSGLGGALQCNVYVVFKERELGRSTTVCGGGPERTREVYMSTSHAVEVRLTVGRMGDGRDRMFLIRYEATGCGDPDVKSYEWFELHGNETTVGCRVGGATWRLTCVEAEWRGERGNCTQDGATERAGMILSTIHASSSMSAMLIPLVILIAVFIGLSILIIGIVYLMRRRHLMLTKTVNQYPYRYDTNGGAVKDTYYKALGLPPAPMYAAGGTTAASSETGGGENEYEYVDDVLRRISLHQVPSQPTLQYGRARPGPSPAPYHTYGLQHAVSRPSQLYLHQHQQQQQYKRNTLPGRAVPCMAGNGEDVARLHRLHPQYYALDPISVRRDCVTPLGGGGVSQQQQLQRSRAGLTDVVGCDSHARINLRLLPEQYAVGAVTSTST